MRKIGLFLVVFLNGFFLLAQEGSDLSLVADIKIESTEDFISFTSTLENNTSEISEYRYEFLVINRSQGGANTTRQNGEVTPGIGEKIELSVSKIGMSKNLKYDCRLFIYKKDKLMTSKSISSTNEIPEVNENINVKENAKKTSRSKNDIPEKKNDDGNDGAGVINPEANLNLLLDGFITDQTRTRGGRDFYEVYYKEWQSKNIKGDFNIEIKEQIARGTSTSIQIYFENALIFQSGLQQKYDVIEELVDYAIARSLQYVASVNNYNENLSNEAKNTGI